MTSRLAGHIVYQSMIPLALFVSGIAIYKVSYEVNQLQLLGSLAGCSFEHIGKSTALLNSRILKTRFLFKFTAGALFSSFINMHETTRKSPFTFIRLNSSLNKKNFYGHTVKTRDDTVRSN